MRSLGFAGLLTGESFADPTLNASASPSAVSVPEACKEKATVGVFNSGDAAATNTKITFELPAGLAFQAGPSALVNDPPASNFWSFTQGTLGVFDGFGVSIGFLTGPLGDFTVNFSVIADNATTVNGSVMVTVVESPQQAHLDGVRVDAGDPVGSFVGNFRFAENVALWLGGPAGIGFQAHYDSGMAADGVVQSALGPGWQHGYELRLTIVGSDATIAFSGGRVLKFKNNAGMWTQTLRTDVGFTLVEGGGEFRLGDPRSQMMYVFDATGKLIRIEDGRGNVTTLTYAGGLLATVSDGLGRTLTFSYDGSNQLTAVSDGTRAVSFGYTGGRLTSFTNADGKTTTYAYDGATARMTSRTRPEGNTPVTQIYSAAGRVTSQADAATGVMTLGYSDDFGVKITTITDQAAQVTTHTYTNAGELSSLHDESGREISLSVDSAGRRSGAFDRTGQFTNIFYDADTGMPDFIQHPGGGLNEFFTYTTRTVNGIAFEDLTRHDLPDLTADEYAYDANGNLTQWTLRDGEIFTFTHNARGQVLTATNPTTGVSTYTYDANARLQTATDTDLGATTYGYDALHRLTGITNPDTTTRAFGHDALNRLTSATNERGHTTSFAYDDNSRLTSVTDALTHAVQYEYDALDRLTRVVDRLGEDVTFTYDARWLPLTTTDRNNNTTTFAHDARRRMTGVTNPAGKTTTFGYDDEGRLTSVTNALGETSTLTRDAMGYVTNVANALGHTATLQRDAMKRVRFAFNPLGNQTSYTYTPRGQLASVMLPNGISASYQYNDLGALSQITDPNTRVWTFTHSPMGRVESMIDPLTRATAYDYDNRGRLSLVTFADTVTLTPTYDDASNVTRLLYSDGTDLNYTYDALNRLATATDGPETLIFTYDFEGRVTNTRQPGPVDFGAGYDAGGRLTSVTYPGGVTVTYGYDSRDRLTSAGDSLTGTTLTFTYDDANRLTGIIRPNGVNTIYDYDAAGRLTRIQEGAIIDLRFTLDANARITEIDYAAAPLDPTTLVTNENTSFTYDHASQVSSAGHTYDARGRQTAKPGATYTWDAASRLVAINAVTNDYNALGDIVTRTEAGATTRFYYNAALGLRPVVAERNETTMQFERLHVWSPGGALLYIINLPGPTVSFPHFDQVGSTLALTNAAGAVSDSYAYDPNGRILAQTGASTQPWRFSGRYGVRHEPAANLLHMRARHYDPALARFISKEPLWPMLDPRKINPYQYARLDPVRRIDRRGSDDEEGSDALEDAFKDGLNANNKHLLMALAFIADKRGIIKPGGEQVTPNAGEETAPGTIQNLQLADLGKSDEELGRLPATVPGTGKTALELEFESRQAQEAIKEMLRDPNTFVGPTAPDPVNPLDSIGFEEVLLGGPSPKKKTAPPAPTPPVPSPSDPGASNPSSFIMPQTPAPVLQGGTGTSASALLFSPRKGVLFFQSRNGGGWSRKSSEPLRTTSGPFSLSDPSSGDAFHVCPGD